METFVDRGATKNPFHFEKTWNLKYLCNRIVYYSKYLILTQLTNSNLSRKIYCGVQKSIQQIGVCPGKNTGFRGNFFSDEKKHFDSKRGLFNWRVKKLKNSQSIFKRLRTINNLRKKTLIASGCIHDNATLKVACF